MIKIKDLSPASTLAMTRKGALLVDVRQPYEVARKSFDAPEVMLIPLGKLEQRLKEVPVERQVIVACNSGSRSVMAARILVNHGYRKVANLQYGIAGWEKAGLPVKRATKQSLLSLLLQKFSGKS